MAQYTVAQALEMLKAQGTKVSRDTLYRYEANYPEILKPTRTEQGARMYTDADLAAVVECQKLAKKAMIDKTREAGTERMAAQRTGVLAKVKVEKVTGAVIRERVAAILQADPVARTDDWRLLLKYYKTWHGTTDMVKLRATGAPTPETIGRRRREVLAALASQEVAG
jgi:DNA-binding transcriptional MerR regulator